MNQTTLADQVVVEGIGVHRGRPARVVLYPADANSGITFLRTNLPGGRQRLVEARHVSVQDTQLCTVIGDPTGASIATIEHLMSALAGLEIDNVLVEIDGPEMPILDGSSRLFVEQILQAGIRRLSAPRKVVKVLRPVRVEMGHAHAELLPHDGFRLDIEIHFANPVIGRQSYAFECNPERYRREVASARTFGFMRDVEALWKAGHARGASLENTVAVGEDRVVNPEGLRFPDEFVRHKLLDAIGDLALAGHALHGAYRAFCPGHKLNVMMLEALFADRANFAITEAYRRPAPVRSERVMQMAAAFAPDVN